MIATAPFRRALPVPVGSGVGSLFIPQGSDDGTWQFGRTTNNPPSMNLAYVSAWFWVSTLSGMSGSPVFIKLGDNFNNGAFMCYGDSATGNIFTCTFAQFSGTNNTGVAVPLGRWFHLGFGNDATNFFVDFNGARIATSTGAFGSQTGVFIGNGNQPGQRLGGFFSNVKVWTRILAEPEAAKEMRWLQPQALESLDSWLPDSDLDKCFIDRTGNNNNWNPTLIDFTLLRIGDGGPPVAVGNDRRHRAFRAVSAAASASSPIPMVQGRTYERSRFASPMSDPGILKLSTTPAPIQLYPTPPSFPQRQLVEMPAPSFLQSSATPAPIQTYPTPPEFPKRQIAEMPAPSFLQLSTTPTPIQFDPTPPPPKRRPVSDMPAPSFLQLSTTPAPIWSDPTPPPPIRRPFVEMPAPSFLQSSVTPAPIWSDPVFPFIPRRQFVEMPAPSFLQLSTTPAPVVMETILVQLALRRLVDHASVPERVGAALPISMDAPIRRSELRKIIEADPALPAVVTVALLPGVPDMPAPWRPPRIGRGADIFPMFPLAIVTSGVALPNADPFMRLNWPQGRPTPMELPLQPGALLSPLPMGDPLIRVRHPLLVDAVQPGVLVLPVPISFPDVVRPHLPRWQPPGLMSVPPIFLRTEDPVEMPFMLRAQRVFHAPENMQVFEIAFVPPPGPLVATSMDGRVNQQYWVRQPPQDFDAFPSLLPPSDEVISAPSGLLSVMMRIITDRLTPRSRGGLPIELSPFLGIVHQGHIKVLCGSGEPVSIPIPTNLGVSFMILRASGVGAVARISSPDGLQDQEFPLSDIIAWSSASEPGRQITRIELWGMAEVEYLLSLSPLS